MVSKIGLSRNGFGITEALAIHILRSTHNFANGNIELISKPEEEASCNATVGFGKADLERNRFSNDIPVLTVNEYTLEKLAGFGGYSIKLSAAGQVFAKFAHQLIPKQDDERNKCKGKHAFSRDFRKIYEYIIEVVDSWHWSIPLQYPMPEKTRLLAFLDDLQNRMDSEWAEKRETDFVAFVEQCVAEIGRKFDQVCCWYIDCYLPAYEYIIDTLKKANAFGFLWFDFNFSKVTLDDLLIRAGNNLRLPRLIIRPSFSKFRLECVRMVKPILYFPRDWVGRTDHVFETLNIEQIDYISSDRTYAIAQTLKAAEQLAYCLLTYAEKTSSIVTAQECWLTIVRDGKKVIQPARSLPGTRDNSTLRDSWDTVTDNEHSEEDECHSKREKAAMELKALAGIATNCNGTSKTEEEEEGQMQKMTSFCNNLKLTNCEDKENSPMLLLDFDDDRILPNGTAEKGKEAEEHQQRNGVGNHWQNESNLGEKQQKVPSSSGSLNSADFPVVYGQMDNNTTIQLQQNQNFSPTLNGIFSDESEVDSLVQKVFNAKRTVLEVPVNSFTISHVLGAAFVGLAIGTAEKNLKIRGLTEPRQVGCIIRLGPGIYEYDDGDRKLTSSHLVSLFSLDLSSDVLDKRLSIAGLCYAFYAKKAIVRIAANGSPEGLSNLLKKGAAKRRLTMVFRRVYHRLVLPIDAWVSDSLTQQQLLPPSTRESALLYNALSNLIDVVNNGEMRLQNGQKEIQQPKIQLPSDECLVAFRISLHICMQFINDMVRSLLTDQ